jgi:hypothetical protein
MRCSEILHLFAQAFKTGKGYNVNCPFHKDTTPSLSCADAERNGREIVIFYCHAGCNNKQIYEWVKEKISDTSYIPPKIDYDKDFNQKGVYVCTYFYLDEKRKIRHSVLRFKDPKRFSQRGYINGEMVYSMDNIERFLYKLPELISATKKFPDCHILIPFGEKDVDNLLKLGFVATTHAGGEKKAWLDSYTNHLIDRNVVVIPDFDITGFRHAVEISEKLIDKVKTLKILILPGILKEHSDISDWLIKGNTAQSLKNLIKASPDLKPFGIEYIRENFKYAPMNYDENLQVAEQSNNLKDDYNLDGEIRQASIEYDEADNHNSVNYNSETLGINRDGLVYQNVSNQYDTDVLASNPQKEINIDKISELEFPFSDWLNERFKKAEELFQIMDGSMIGFNCKSCKDSGYVLYTDSDGEYFSGIVDGEVPQIEKCGCKFQQSAGDFNF